MEYNDIIRNKNRVLAITLLICIVLRCIVNAFFTGIGDVIPMGIGGFVLTALLLFLSSKVHPVVMMYAMVLLMSGIGIALMIAFPCTTNYLMFFLAIFFVLYPYVIHFLIDLLTKFSYKYALYLIKYNKPRDWSQIPTTDFLSKTLMLIAILNWEKND